jgi:hypothetical protein
MDSKSCPFLYLELKKSAYGKTRQCDDPKQSVADILIEALPYIRALPA